MDVMVSHSEPIEDSGPGARSDVWWMQWTDAKLCRDVWGGTRRMREAEKEHLPQFAKEHDDLYAFRVETAVLFNAFRKTIRGLTGMVFRKDPTLSEEVSEKEAEQLKNCDMAGRTLAQFSRDLFRDKLKVGHSHIFVDWHGDAGGGRRKVDEKEARPYFTMIMKEQVIRFRTENHDGRIVLTSFAYLSLDTVPVDEFTDATIERIRQYDLQENKRVLCRSWTRTAYTEDEWDVEEEGFELGERMDEIPLVTDYAERVGFMISEPPLIDIAFENVRHWQARSDRDNNLHVAQRPIFVVKGLAADQIGTFVVGPAIGVALPDSEMDAFYRETTGAALSASRDELQDIEARMASQGLALLQRQSRAAETADARRLDKGAQDSELAEMAHGTGDALNEARRLMAKWEGRELEGSVEMNREFESQKMDSAMVAVLVKAVADRSLSLETMWEALQQGEVLPDSFDPEIERERIEAQEDKDLKNAVAMMEPEEEEEDTE